MGIFKGPKTPTPPPVPPAAPPPPKIIDTAAQDAANEQRRKAGVATSTALTGPRGLLDNPKTSKKVALGY